MESLINCFNFAKRRHPLLFVRIAHFYSRPNAPFVRNSIYKYFNATSFCLVTRNIIKPNNHKIHVPVCITVNSLFRAPISTQLHGERERQGGTSRPRSALLDRAQRRRKNGGDGGKIISEMRVKLLFYPG